MEAQSLRYKYWSLDENDRKEVLKFIPKRMGNRKEIDYKIGFREYEKHKETVKRKQELADEIAKIKIRLHDIYTELYRDDLNEVHIILHHSGNTFTCH